MNRRFKLLKRAVKTKDPNTWADYKRLRNEIASDLNLEKHNLLISEINLTRRRQLRLTLYGDVMSKATKPKVRKKIGSLRHDNNNQARNETEKASLMNSSFSTIGQTLTVGQSQYFTSPKNIRYSSIQQWSREKKLVHWRKAKLLDRIRYQPNYWNLQDPLLYSR